MRARSTTDVWLALRGLPNAVVETLLAPRMVAVGTVLAGHAGLRTARRLAWAMIVSAAWLFASMLLLLTYGISLIVSGPSTQVTVVIAVVWTLVTWASWRTWRRRSRRA